MHLYSSDREERSLDERQNWLDHKRQSDVTNRHYLLIKLLEHRSSKCVQDTKVNRKIHITSLALSNSLCQRRKRGEKLN